ncbi:hypothetical protein [Mucilaginibacter myungsuensis]|uniref:Uncharacterized protein n=1 Tax=Mucilaginibacter myungsuensis TaxID=649104 RepID=A0A929PVE9_9SPHI|nr:hypothetical protein [Mucilaginibacter myungsuensis]MBE9661713.1 hypothetical protein [Mucilaginibacter myungsuensis]MDN3597856.1 hypothetical protein [Mucilaginibacter myungsuensis]
MKFSYCFALVILLAACDSKRPDMIEKDTNASVPAKTAATAYIQLHTDTLQYLHFEGNFDYWYGMFINAKKDSVLLVTTDQIPAKFRNKLVEVKWFADSLSEAGEGETKYAGKRLKAIKQVSGNPFAAPVSEEQVITDIKALPEVQANAEQIGIAERPTDEKEYYLVETGTRDEDHFSRLYMFRVYVYPKYQIRFYDGSADTELSLDAWRKNKP